jgi:O-antigen/teichoic acid export membrane protein
MKTMGNLDSNTVVNQHLSSKIESRGRHFDNAHLVKNMRERTLRGGVITIVAQAFKFLLQIGSTMVLARILTPDDFGLIAMVSSVTGFVAMFKDAGLASATVQRKEITHEQVSTLFWVNVGMGLLVALTTAALAPAIAVFYKDSRLVLITIVLALAIVLGGFTVQHQALLRRQMQFRTLAFVEVASMGSGVFVAIAMAFFSLGYWSLVGMTIGSSMANAILVWWFCRWFPSRPKWSTGVGSMLRFGGGLTGFNFLNYFVRNADNIIIGFSLGSGPLGIYSKAYGLLMLPIKQINGPVSNVMIPALSRLQNEPIRYRHAYLKAISMISLVSMPFVVSVVVLADDAVNVLLGAGWESVSTVFRWLAPAAFFGTLNVAPGWLCVSLGRSKTPLIWASIMAPITVIGFLIGAQFGVVGVAGAFSLTWCVGLYLFVALACHTSPVRQRDIALHIFPQVLSSLLAGVAANTLNTILSEAHLNPILRFSFVVIFFAVAYMCGIFVFPAQRKEIVNLFYYRQFWMRKIK